MPYQAVLFDLDGTLLDTLQDLADAGNKVLESKGLKPHPVDAYRYFVGSGVRHLMERILPRALGEDEKIVLKKDQMAKGTVNISFPEKEIKLSKQNVKIGVYDQSGKLLDTFETYFEGPFKIQF